LGLSLISLSFLTRVPAFPPLQDFRVPLSFPGPFSYDPPGHRFSTSLFSSIMLNVVRSVEASKHFAALSFNPPLIQLIRKRVFHGILGTASFPFFFLDRLGGDLAITFPFPLTFPPSLYPPTANFSCYMRRLLLVPLPNGASDFILFPWSVSIS